MSQEIKELKDKLKVERDLVDRMGKLLKQISSMLPCNEIKDILDAWEGIRK